MLTNVLNTREIEHRAIINQNTKHQSISITDRRRLKSICILSTTEFNHIELSQSSRAFFLRTAEVPAFMT